MNHKFLTKDAHDEKHKKKTTHNLTEYQKWMICLYSALLFLLISSPFMYQLTNQLTIMTGFETSSNGCPNLYGILLHGIVFLILVRVLMLITNNY
jgi:hypothetical protein